MFWVVNFNLRFALTSKRANKIVYDIETHKQPPEVFNQRDRLLLIFSRIEIFFLSIFFLLAAFFLFLSTCYSPLALAIRTFYPFFLRILFISPHASNSSRNSSSFIFFKYLYKFTDYQKFRIWFYFVCNSVMNEMKRNRCVFVCCIWLWCRRALWPSRSRSPFVTGRPVMNPLINWANINRLWFFAVDFELITMEPYKSIHSIKKKK